MAELSIRELVELSTALRDDSSVASDNVMARLHRAHQIVDRQIAMLRSDMPSRDALPEDWLTGLEATRDVVRGAYASLRESKAQSSPRLERLINGTASLHNKINTLCWLVGESQADEDETLPGNFSSADDLFDAMGV